MTDDGVKVPFDQTTDAVAWAEEFQSIYVRLQAQKPHETPINDTGWLIGWFANAIERGVAAGAAPFGGDGQAMTGYEVAEAMEQGRKLLIRFLSGGDVTWWLAGDKTDDHPEGTPPSWYRENIGQINIIVRDVTGAPEFEGVSQVTPPRTTVMQACFDAESRDPAFWLCSLPGCILPIGHDDPEVTEEPVDHCYTSVTVRNVPNDGP